MRLAFARLSAGFAILMVAACAQAAALGNKQSERVFSHAFAMRGCTQEDAPALEIYLTQTPFAGIGDPSSPFIRFEIGSSPSDAIAPASLKLTQLRRDPQSTGRLTRGELVEPGHDPLWLSGTITLKDAAPGKQVSGRYDLTTPNGSHLGGSFTAEYSKRTTVCG